MSSLNENDENITSLKQTEHQIVNWIKSLDLSYDTVNDNERSAPTAALPFDIPSSGCFFCGNMLESLSTCAKCKVAKYCSRDCQLSDWKSGASWATPADSSQSSATVVPNVPHKHLCKALQIYGGASLTFSTDDKKETVCNTLWKNIRFYACPYSIHHSDTLGKGFCFIQSQSTLSQIAIPRSVFSSLYYEQRQDQRSVLIHFLTVGEYDQELCRDDFELASVRDELVAAVNEYDREKELVILMRFRCGYVTLGTVKKLVPDLKVCRALGRDYYANNRTMKTLQLNLDDL